MARKIKIPNEHLKRYARQEQKRKLNVCSKLMYYLIVCGGEATEPNYFEGLQDLPKGVLTAYQIEIEGTGRNTQSAVDRVSYGNPKAFLLHINPLSFAFINTCSVLS